MTFVGRGSPRICHRSTHIAQKPPETASRPHHDRKRVGMNSDLQESEVLICQSCYRKHHTGNEYKLKTTPNHLINRSQRWTCRPFELAVFVISAKAVGFAPVGQRIKSKSRTPLLCRENDKIRRLLAKPSQATVPPLQMRSNLFSSEDVWPGCRRERDHLTQ